MRSATTNGESERRNPQYKGSDMIVRRICDHTRPVWHPETTSAINLSICNFRKFRCFLLLPFDTLEIIGVVLLYLCPGYLVSLPRKTRSITRCHTDWVQCNVGVLAHGSLVDLCYRSVTDEFCIRWRSQCLRPLRFVESRIIVIVQWATSQRVLAQPLYRRRFTQLSKLQELLSSVTSTHPINLC